MSKTNKISTLTYIQRIIEFFCIILGCFILAFGTAVFYTNLNIVAGGVSGVGIIIQHFVSQQYPDVQIIDIVAAILNVIFWVIGLIFIGKKFAWNTLFATLLYPAFLSLCLRVSFFSDLATQVAGDGSVGNLILCSLFGGVSVGTGVALTFLGGGSTGGFDVMTFILEKYLKIKESVGSFILDGSVIACSMLLISDNFVPSLCGILGAFIAAIVIEYLYEGSTKAFQADIISDKWQEISNFAQTVMGRGTTIIHAEGGYKGEERIILRIVFPRYQYRQLREFISRLDSKSFVTFTKTNAVFGEGFKNYDKKTKQ